MAVLDNAWPEHIEPKDRFLYVNWFKQPTLFDFNQVIIIQATDEQVERFAVRVGNDTDPYRKQRYTSMPCTVSPACQLSQNTLKILQRTFAQVTRQ